MLAIVQRCTSSSITVDNEIISDISLGLLIFLGVYKGDEKKDSEYIAKKITALRIFNDKKGKMNLSVNDVKGSILVVSQFTLCGSVKKGRRPSFVNAETPELSFILYKNLITNFKEVGIHTFGGSFGKMMNVELINTGPATFIINSKEI